MIPANDPKRKLNSKAKEKKAYAQQSYKVDTLTECLVVLHYYIDVILHYCLSCARCVVIIKTMHFHAFFFFFFIHSDNNVPSFFVSFIEDNACQRSRRFDFF